MALPSARGLLRTMCKHPRYMRNLLARRLALRARFRWVEQHRDKDGQVPPPLAYKLVLTYRCNLRCCGCYQWGDTGWCHTQPSSTMARELDWAVIERLLAEPSLGRPDFILIGGEPLLYSRFGDLVKLLQQRKCFATVCTNGLLLDRFLDAARENPYLAFLVSLDGLEAENDLLRGQGVYRKVTGNIEQLKRLNRPPYVGVQFTIRPQNVRHIYSFCRDMVSRGVDWILLNPSWFISEAQARKFECFMREHFALSPTTHLAHMTPYPLDAREFVCQMEKINAQRWPIQISCYLQTPDDIYAFVEAPDVPPGNSFCYLQWLRMDIQPDGKVTPCFIYPDLFVGDLTEQNPMEAWNSAAFADFRRIRRKETLPICAKCNALYLYDAKRKYL